MGVGGNVHLPLPFLPKLCTDSNLNCTSNISLVRGASGFDCTPRDTFPSPQLLLNTPSTLSLFLPPLTLMSILRKYGALLLSKSNLLHQLAGTSPPQLFATPNPLVFIPPSFLSTGSLSTAYKCFQTPSNLK